MIRYTRALAAFALVFFSISLTHAEAAADAPERNGFTFEAHLGMSHVVERADGADATQGLGVAPLGLGLGGYFTPDFGMLVRMTGASHFADINGEEEQLTNTFLGIVGQYWPSNRLMVSGGVGLSTYAPNTLNSSLSDTEAEQLTRTGYGFSLRSGYSLGAWANHSLRTSVEVLPTFLDGTFVVGSSLILEYQFY